jgi:hypothetical protein
MGKVKRRGAKRPHSEAMLSAKKAARALGIAWCAYRVYRGWGKAHDAFWRSGFQKALGRKMAKGADWTIIERGDEIAESVRQNVPEFAEAESADIWEVLLAPYEPRTSTDSLYVQALGNVISGRGGCSADTGFSPF